MDSEEIKKKVEYKFSLYEKIEGMNDNDLPRSYVTQLKKEVLLILKDIDSCKSEREIKLEEQIQELEFEIVRLNSVIISKEIEGEE